MTQANDYLEPLTPANAAVLFIDNQTTLMLGVQSIDTTLFRTNTEGLAKLAKLFASPVVLTTTDGGANGPSGPVLKPIGFLDQRDQRRCAAAVDSDRRHTDQRPVECRRTAELGNEHRCRGDQGATAADDGMVRRLHAGAVQHRDERQLRVSMR
jgi:nicotinamidase-related amidase